MAVEDKEMQILIIGAGIGGLTAVLTLLRSGIAVQVFEQATELREVGAGRFVNFVGVVPGKDWCVESWSAKGEVADALAECATWHPQVPQIIRLVCSPLNWTRALHIRYRLNRSNGNLRRSLYARCYHAEPEAGC
jgi:threonine dehydrogenase-like Zn-dependent dehydrogenase